MLTREISNIYLLSSIFINVHNSYIIEESLAKTARIDLDYQQYIPHVYLLQNQDSLRPH